jgi:hypothetical protein
MGTVDRPAGDAGFADEGSAGAASDVIAQALDGATGDYAVSGDAMRWSPDLAERPPRSTTASVALPGLEAAAGLGSVLGLDAAGVRRLVSGALYSLTTAAGDVVSELRQLTRGSAADDDPAG